jgi:hypothetical protein
MTLALVIDKGVSCLSLRLEDEEQLVPYRYIRELLGPKKEAPEQVEVQENMLEGFWRFWEKTTRSPKFLLVGISLGVEYMKQGK